MEKHPLRVRSFSLVATFGPRWTSMLLVLITKTSNLPRDQEERRLIHRRLLVVSCGFEILKTKMASGEGENLSKSTRLALSF